MTPLPSAMRADELDLASHPRRRGSVACSVVPGGKVAWVDQDRAPVLLDPAAAVLLQLFDGTASLAEIVADLEAELGPTEHDLATGTLAMARRLGAEGFLDGVDAEPGRRLPSVLFRQLTDGVAFEAAHAGEHGGRSVPEPWELDERLLGAGDEAHLATIDLPSSPVRVYTTLPTVRAALTTALGDRLANGPGPLLFAVTEGTTATVGRPLCTLWGTRGAKLAVGTDQARLAERLLRHLSLSCWLAEEPGHWWTGLRTLIGPDGAVLIASSLLDRTPGFGRAAERAGYEVVDSVMSALDPGTGEVLVHPTRFDPVRGEVPRDEAGAVRRLPLSTIAVGPTDYAVMTDDGVALFAKALAVAVEPGPHVECQTLLDRAVALATDAHRVVLGGGPVRAAVAALRP